MVCREELCVGGWSSADVALTLLLPILHPALLIILQSLLHLHLVLILVFVIIVQLLTTNINMRRETLLCYQVIFDI